MLPGGFLLRGSEGAHLASGAAGAPSLVQTLLLLPRGLLLAVCVCLCCFASSCKDVSLFGLGPTLLPCDLNLTYILTTSAKTLFPRRVIAIGTRY